MTWIIVIACGLVGFLVHDESTSRAALILLIVLDLLGEKIVRTVKEDR